jgi:3,4-dihydroxy 2-butanone 4-phosphate synthase / GTP cyclohydrolase II
MLTPGGPASASAYPVSALLPRAPQTSLAPRQVSLSFSLCVRLGKVIEPQRVRRVVSTVLPTAHGTFQVHGYTVEPGRDHVALVLGDLDHAGSNGHVPLVRVHSECLTGDAFGSWRCDCGEQLEAAMREIGSEGLGVIIYLRGHEGRGIGLHAKLHAYALQDAGLDTVDANLRLGLPVDARDYNVAAAILGDLGLRRIRLLSGNPKKSSRLTDLGIEVTARLPLPVTQRAENAHYLATKHNRMGHDSARKLPGVWNELLQGRVPDRAAAGAEARLLDRYGSLVAAGPTITIAQLAQSVDGFIASRTGDANYVSGTEDREHLHRLRALVDAVVVGAQTVTADDPQLTTRAVPGPSPVRLIIDPSGRIPGDARVLTDGRTKTLWCVAAEVATPPELSDHVDVVTLPIEAGRFEPEAVLAMLRARGLGRMLVEGGGRTVSEFLAAGVLDRLYLTTAPILVGDGIPGVRFAGADLLADALTASVRRFSLGRDHCTVFDFAAARQPRRSARQGQDVAMPDLDPEDPELELGAS